MKTKLNKKDKKNIVLLLQKYDNTMTNDTINEIVTEIQNVLNWERDTNEKYRNGENTDRLDYIMEFICDKSVVIDDENNNGDIDNELCILLELGQNIELSNLKGLY